MKRRDFLKKAATATATVAGGSLVACGGQESGSAPAVVTQPRLNWRMASSFPRVLDTIYGGAEFLAARIEALSEGRFRIRPYPSGELVPGFEVLDAVQQGTVQVGHAASYYFKGKNPTLAFDTAMPFGLTARQQNAWLDHGGGLELLREVFSDFNVVNFAAGNTGAQMGGWFKREIATLDDLKGLTMRIPGLGGDVMERLGVTTQQITGGEIYQALERGAIDAAEWVGPYDDEKLDFHKVARYYYYPGWWEPGPSLSVYVNKDAWEKLPKLYQEIFTSAAREANLNMLAQYDALNPAALTRLVDGGVELRPFSQEILRAAQQSAFEVMAEQAAREPSYAKVFEAWKKVRDETYSWFKTAELAYAQFGFSS